MRRLAIALVHHPVLDRAGAIVTSAVTNLDVHDLSRSARTFGAESFFVTSPIEAQRDLVSAIVGHWKDGSSGKRIPSRKEALEGVRVVANVEEAVASFGGRANVEIWITAARADAGGVALDWDAARARLRSDDPRVVLVLFGTSWGLAPSLCAEADGRLPPITGPTAYNHLSVRAACAITLDRLVAW
ncbi:MAG: RNA methyltransferase [Myxococcales bacterium]|nr:RNA methyltransferase [Myxococcales bacterium]MBL8720412.1 RNA methyltransferase [Myxococcales bacterium]